jgi:hypothetical protein
MYELRAIPAWVLGALGMFCFYKSGWHFRRPLTLGEMSDLSFGAILKLARLKGARVGEWDLTLREMLKQDFTLYLRSFLDDPIEVLRDGLTYRLWAVGSSFDKLRFVSLEKVVAQTVWPFGKVVAVGEPGHSDTSSGASPEAALRIVVRDDWQKVVGTWIQEARYVLMTVGGTVGLRWELQQLVQSGAWEKLTLILRHDKPAAMARAWRQFWSDFPALLSYQDDVVARSVAVRFSDEGRLPIFLSVGGRSVASYKVALNICLLPLDQLLDIIRVAGTADG